MGRWPETVFLVLALLGLVLPSRAEEVERKGLFVGVSTGLGWLDCEECRAEAVGLSFDIGGMVGRRFGLSFAVHSVVEDSRSEMGGGIGGVAVRFWPRDRLWLSMGAGIAALGCDSCVSSAAGLGAMGGVGVELLQRRHFVLDLQARSSLASAGDGGFKSVSVTVGVSWY